MKKNYRRIRLLTNRILLEELDGKKAGPWEAELNEIMEIQNPREALLKLYRLVHSEDLPLTVMENAVDRYTKRYCIESEDMTFFPNGQPVITQDVDWALTGNDFDETVIQDILDQEGSFEYLIEVL